jgi:Xaa-Pro aminopeptidase
VSAPAAGTAARAARASLELEQLELDAMIVDAPFDLRYLTGFTGSNGLALLMAGQSSSSRPNLFLTDFRYTAQSAEEVDPAFERSTIAGELRDAVPALLEGSGRLGFDETKLTVRAHRRLAEQMPEGWELVACAGLVERLRLVKEPGEVELIAAACELADAALQEILEQGLVGRTERRVALALEQRMRELGAEQPSFPSIVAAAEHGALPHAQPRDVEIGGDVLVTIDWGAQLAGYCSDCTRTFATGEGISEQAREIYELVLAAQLAGLDALRPGRSGREVDAVARAVIEQGGQGEHFGHGLGHGVGLEVHEGPRLSRTASDAPLEEGNVVTVEPGVYLPDALGVRIEDLVVMRSDGPEVLTRLSKDLAVIS